MVLPGSSRQEELPLGVVGVPQLDRLLAGSAREPHRRRRGDDHCIRLRQLGSESPLSSNDFSIPRRRAARPSARGDEAQEHVRPGLELAGRAQLLARRERGTPATSVNQVGGPPPGLKKGLTSASVLPSSSRPSANSCSSFPVFEKSNLTTPASASLGITNAYSSPRTATGSTSPASSPPQPAERITTPLAASPAERPTTPRTSKRAYRSTHPPSMRHARAQSSTADPRLSAPGRQLAARSCSHWARSIAYSTSPSSSPGILTGQSASNVRT